MSDEEQNEYEGPRGGESEHEWMQRMTSPELRWLDLFHRLTARLEANESRVEANEEESRRREERIQGRMEFLLQQQAQFNADMQQLREAQAQSDEKWERRWGRTEESIRSLLAIAQIQSEEIAALAKTQAESQARTDERIVETNERIAEANERLNALINFVERIISERRNGGNGGTAEGG